jgi:hypothetical protein
MAIRPPYDSHRAAAQADHGGDVRRMIRGEAFNMTRGFMILAEEIREPRTHYLADICDLGAVGI